MYPNDYYPSDIDYQYMTDDPYEVAKAWGDLPEDVDATSYPEIGPEGVFSHESL